MQQRLIVCEFCGKKAELQDGKEVPVVLYSRQELAIPLWDHNWCTIQAYNRKAVPLQPLMAICSLKCLGGFAERQLKALEELRLYCLKDATEYLRRHKACCHPNGGECSTCGPDSIAIERVRMITELDVAGQ